MELEVILWIVWVVVCGGWGAFSTLMQIDKYPDHSSLWRLLSVFLLNTVFTPICAVIFVYNHMRSIKEGTLIIIDSDEGHMISQTLDQEPSGFDKLVYNFPGGTIVGAVDTDGILQTIDDDYGDIIFLSSDNKLMVADRKSINIVDTTPYQQKQIKYDGIRYRHNARKRSESLLVKSQK